MPSQISLSQIETKDYSWSPSMYRQTIIANKNVVLLRDLLDKENPFDKGNEPGSMWYLHNSSNYLIRTKALQEYSCLLYPKGNSIVPINPRVFVDFKLAAEDILLSKDSNVGEVAIVDGDNWSNYMFSGGIVRLHPSFDRYYIYSFLKHPLFKVQLISMTSRGSTITHAKSLWLDCLIPFPNQPDSDKVVSYVSALMRAIVAKEIAIKKRHEAILLEINKELLTKQTGNSFSYAFPTNRDIGLTSRLDTGLYNEDFKKYKHLVDSYEKGSTCLSKMGIESRRGPNLAVSVIGKSLYSDEPKQNWYQLIRPTNISEYGTLTNKEWLGNKKELLTVNPKDLILGCEGFEKGRSIVIVEGIEKCTTNFHGTVLFSQNAELWEIIFVRCFLAYLREHGIIDWVGVGGSGGHMSPEYFDYLPFPNFPDAKKKEIAKLYYNESPPPSDKLTNDNFVEWHNQWNSTLGIYQLDRELEKLHTILLKVQKAIIEGTTVEV